MSDEAGCQIYVPQWQERLGWKLFPRKSWCEIPEMEKTQDYLVSRTVMELSFFDRLRVLFGGRIQVETKTATENEIGHHKTNGHGCVIPPKFLDRRGD